MVSDKDKKEAKNRWRKGVFLDGILGILTAWFMFFPAWWFRNMGKKSPFWIWMDDSRLDVNSPTGYAKDYYAYLFLEKGVTEENIWIAYKWHKRNSIWNLKAKHGGIKEIDIQFPDRPGNNNINVLETTIDNLKKLDGTYLAQDLDWKQVAGLKYIPKSPDLDPWQVNQGDEISNTTSIVGEGKIWYTLNNGSDTIYFRYSKCEIITYKILGIKIWTGWKTIKKSTGKTFGYSIKHQKIKPIVY